MQQGKGKTGKVAPGGMGAGTMMGAETIWISTTAGLLAVTMLFELAETFPKKARGREEQRSVTLGVNPCSIMICMASGSLSTGTVHSTLQDS